MEFTNEQLARIDEINLKVLLTVWSTLRIDTKRDGERVLKMNIKRKCAQYQKWLVSKRIRIYSRWTNNRGRNRSYLDFKLAGYIGRHRQIKKCFMKGWYNGYENFKSVRDREAIQAVL